MEASAAQVALLEKLAARPLSRSGAVALHWQCSELLRSLVEQTHYPPAVPLPAENDMARALGISRPTLRQAMSRLAADGVLHSQRGVGTFALRGGLVRPVGLSSLFRDLENEGRTPTTRVLLLERVPADATVAAALHVVPGAPLLHLERVRLADGRPVVLTRSYLSLPEGVTLTEDQLENDGLYNLLHRVAGIELVGGVQAVSARVADEQEVDFLHVPPRSAVMIAHRVAFDTAGRGVEYVHITYPEGTELVSDLRGTSVRPATDGQG